jgi:hypothetical protein
MPSGKAKTGFPSTTKRSILFPLTVFLFKWESPARLAALIEKMRF